MGCERAVTLRLSSVLRLLTINITEGAIHMQVVEIYAWLSLS